MSLDEILGIVVGGCLMLAALLACAFWPRTEDKDSEERKDE